jgi:solute carrier family 25 folate transporter 32
VRTRLQDRELKYAGTLDCIRRTYRGEGPTGFYKGLAPNLLRVVPATMITFLVYENISHYMLNRKTASPGAASSG